MAEIFYQLDPPLLVIGIAGASSSGKTTLIKSITSQFVDNFISNVDMDGYHFHTRKERDELNEFPEDIKANNFKQLISDIETLKKGKQILTPTYDHKRGIFGESHILTPKNLIFVEGLHAGKVNEVSGNRLIDFTIFVYPDENLRKVWKVKRDVYERSYSYSGVIKQISSRDYFVDKYIFPQIDTAEILLHTRVDDMGVIINSILISPNFYTQLKSCCVFDLSTSIEINKMYIRENEFYEINIACNNEIDSLINNAVDSQILKPDCPLFSTFNNSTYSKSIYILLILILIKIDTTTRR